MLFPPCLPLSSSRILWFRFWALPQLLLLLVMWINLVVIANELGYEFRKERDDHHNHGSCDSHGSCDGRDNHGNCGIHSGRDDHHVGGIESAVEIVTGNDNAGDRHNFHVAVRKFLAPSSGRWIYLAISLLRMNSISAHWYLAMSEPVVSESVVSELHMKLTKNAFNYSTYRDWECCRKHLFQNHRLPSIVDVY